MRPRLNHFFLNIKNCISGENGGPMLETVIALSAGLGVLAAILFFGGNLLNHIGQAKEHVSSLT